MNSEIHVEDGTLFIETEKNIEKIEPLLQFDNSEINSEYDDANPQKPYPANDIRIEKAVFSVYELKRKIGSKNNGKTRLDSSFQRNDVWKEKQQIELIESVLMGLPLPLFYFSKDSEGKLIVVDGRQRLTAFFKFMDDEFALKGLKHLPPKYECKFSEFDSLTQSKIEDYQLQTNLILPPTPERVQYDIFERVNRAGTPLNKQEIRNALNQGHSTELLNKLAKSDLFSEVTQSSFANDKRMKSQYLLLRLICFYLWRQKKFNCNGNENYSFKTSDEMFAFSMRLVNHYTVEKVSELENSIIHGLKNFLRYCDSEELRLNTNGRRTPINMNVFECIMYIMMMIPNSLEKKIVREKMSLLKSNGAFLKNLEKHRDTEQDIIERLEIAESIARELQK